MHAHMCVHTYAYLSKYITWTLQLMLRTGPSHVTPDNMTILWKGEQQSAQFGMSSDEPPWSPQVDQT